MVCSCLVHGGAGTRWKNVNLATLKNPCISISMHTLANNTISGHRLDALKLNGSCKFIETLFK